MQSITHARKSRGAIRRTYPGLDSLSRSLRSSDRTSTSCSESTLDRACVHAIAGSWSSPRSRKTAGREKEGRRAASPHRLPSRKGVEQLLTPTTRPLHPCMKCAAPLSAAVVPCILSTRRLGGCSAAARSGQGGARQPAHTWASLVAPSSLSTRSPQTVSCTRQRTA